MAGRPRAPSRACWAQDETPLPWPPISASTSTRSSGCRVGGRSPLPPRSPTRVTFAPSASSAASARGASSMTISRETPRGASAWLFWMRGTSPAPGTACAEMSSEPMAASPRSTTPHASTRSWPASATGVAWSTTRITERSGRTTCESSWTTSTASVVRQPGVGSHLGRGPARRRGPDPAVVRGVGYAVSRRPRTLVRRPDRGLRARHPPRRRAPRCHRWRTGPRSSGASWPSGVRRRSTPSGT